MTCLFSLCTCTQTDLGQFSFHYCRVWWCHSPTPLDSTPYRRNHRMMWWVRPPNKSNQQIKHKQTTLANSSLLVCSLRSPATILISVDQNGFPVDDGNIRRSMGGCEHSDSVNRSRRRCRRPCELCCCCCCFFAKLEEDATCLPLWTLPDHTDNITSLKWNERRGLNGGDSDIDTNLLIITSTVLIRECALLRESGCIDSSPQSLITSHLVTLHTFTPLHHLPFCFWYYCGTFLWRSE